MANQQANTTQFTTASSVDQLQKIGAGHCGSVWAVAPTTQPCNSSTTPALVIKREDCGEGRSITHEYDMHLHIIKSLQTPRVPEVFRKLRVNIPRCEGFLSNDASVWPQVLPRLPKNHTSCNALISEKIPPMPRHIRKLLATTLGFGTDPDAVADDASNSHCLVRPYMGRRKNNHDTYQNRPTSFRFYSLRNLPLSVDIMEGLGLDLDSYALAMADALAFLYWTAKVDANDVEFALAQHRESAFETNQPVAPSLGITSFYSEAFGSHSMWILDFDCCREMTMDEAGIRQACRSFWRNDPYYPRPSRPGSNGDPEDQRLWGVFQDRFLETSDRLLQDEEDSVRQLPRQLVNLILQTKGMFNKGTEFW
ncbi:hypothetical protein CkaCkLH20_11478 [Colletotrichum karsti]|uniref:DUF3669 domain-containing protein n=1 Tax=Colletotrichum karsti TaxID=1095194 RepID=A0A9P6HXW2_9PEZI|nr:uncharacterized protein CkaCkLH20_11478 [Colletotrichum karsti]KAF9871061.1 hypothetical protein CkaCkLH20_11478 [Colletotrichum karsti]